MILTFPRVLMRDRSWMWELAARTVLGGKTVAGAQPVARLDGGGLWVATMGDVQVSSADEVRCWRALAALLDSGAAPVALEARDARFTPWPMPGGTLGLPQSEAPHNDDASLNDATNYVGDVITASLVDAASLRATSLRISFTNASALRGGEHFSIFHPTFRDRLYRVGQVTIDGSGYSVVTIRPPLREAMPAGTRLEFDYPKCTMQLASADAMDLALQHRFYGQATVKFIEAMPPFDDV